MSTSEQTHSPDMEELYKRFDIYPYKNMSIAVLKKSKDIVMKAFEHTHPEYEFILPITVIPGLINENAMYFGEPGVAYPVTTGRKHRISI